MSDRVASLPDEPEAGLAVRLLLALGIQPEHVDQLGEDAAVEAAARFRSAAHRSPMIAEDWHMERELRENLQAALRDVLGNDTPEARASARQLLEWIEEGCPR